MTAGTRLAGLDVLRAWAITWVVLTHLEQHHFIDAFPVAFRLLAAHGGAGVDVFFVLSGFLIGRILYRELDQTRDVNLRTFWWRRWARTLPAYYVTLAVVALSTVAIRRGTPWLHPWAYLFFIQNYLSVGSRFTWSWSLCVEEQFYVALPLILIAVRRLFPRAGTAALVRGVAVAAFCFTLVARVHAGLTADLSDWDKYMQSLYAVTHCRLDGLSLGLFIATLPRFTLGRASAVALASVSLLCWTAVILSIGWRPIAENLFAVLGSAGLLVVLLGRPDWMSMRVPGSALVSDLSYGIYLLNPLVFEIATRAIGPSMPLVPALVAIAGTFGVAFAMRRLIELPVLRLRDRISFEAPIAATPRA